MEERKKGGREGQREGPAVSSRLRTVKLFLWDFSEPVLFLRGHVSHP